MVLRGLSGLVVALRTEDLVGLDRGKPVILKIEERESTHLPRYLLVPEWGLDQGDRSVKSMLPQLLEGMSF